VERFKVLLFKIPLSSGSTVSGFPWLRQILAMLANQQLLRSLLPLAKALTLPAPREIYDCMRNGELSYCKFLSKIVTNRYQMKQTRIGDKI
jgi:hypothetical protein